MAKKSTHNKRVKKSKKPKRWTFNPACVDCSVDTHYIQENYMVNDSLWEYAGMSKFGGRLCVKCLEKRIGRKLNRRDFFLCPLNIEPYFHKEIASKRLRKRLSRSF